MLGIDLVHIPEFQKQVASGGDTFLKKAFGVLELHNRQPEHLAGLWAAKEAVVKAGGLNPGEWQDIHISHSANGAPRARVGTDEYEISIAHHGEYAVAVAQKIEKSHDV
jgi:phosphopantetheine--protein transferase-like protein